MKISLYVISALCWFRFVEIALQSKTSIHEIEYILFALMAVIAMSAAHIIGLLSQATEKASPRIKGKRFWTKPGDLS